jgi:hypothetical protein
MLGLTKEEVFDSGESQSCDSHSVEERYVCKRTDNRINHVYPDAETELFARQEANDLQPQNADLIRG